MLTFRPKKKSYTKQHILAITLIGSTLAFCGYNDSQKETIKTISIISPIQKTEQVSRGEVDREEFQKEKVIKAINNHLGGLLSNTGDFFYQSGQAWSVNPMLMAAISYHETLNGSPVQIIKGKKYPSVLKKCNNVAGINWDYKIWIKENGKAIQIINPYKKDGWYNVYPSIQVSVEEMAKKLRWWYIDDGKCDIYSIGKKWAPPDDARNGMYGMDNNKWPSEVEEIYKKILEEAKQ